MAIEHKHILILSGRNSSVDMLNGLPIEITLFQTKDRVTPLQYDLAKRVIIADLFNRDEIIRHVKAIHAYHPFDAVVSFLEHFLVTAALIADQLGIAGNPLYPVEMTINKINMRQLMQKNNIPSLDFFRCSNYEDVMHAARAFAGNPFVLKPTCGSGSRRVSLVQNLSDIDQAWAWASAKNEELIAEAYVDGKEYSVEGLSHRGEHRILAITEKETTGAPHFIETGHRQPIHLSASLQKSVEETVIFFLQLIRQQEGPSHTEIRIRDGVPYIIESHTRYGGDRIWEMVYLTQGIHIPQTTICQLLGIDVPLHRSLYKAAAVKFVTTSPKLCTEIRGVDEAEQQEGIYRVELEVKPGMYIEPLRSSLERCGYVLGGAETTDEAWQRVERSAHSIEIR